MNHQIYKNYCITNFPQEPILQAGRCKLFCTQMANKFPELTLQFGYINSQTNPDNYHPIKLKPYLHVWLVDKSNRIVDPTILQFINLGEIKYHLFTGDFTGFCFECGDVKYDNSPVCNDKDCRASFELEHQHLT